MISWFPFERTLRICLLFLWLPLRAHGAGPYQIHTLSEKQTLTIYTQLLRQACQFADVAWQTSAFDPAAGLWGDGLSVGNTGIRTVVSLDLACAALVKYDDGLDAATRRALREKTFAALRYCAATHVTGAQKCPDGKQWGSTFPSGSGNWQSPMWTGTLAAAAWLVWDEMDPSLRQDVERVIAWEDDMQTKGHPPTGLWLDTKAEENGWVVPPLVLGELMFPKHPHAAAWHQSAEEYMMNTLCTAADLRDASVVDGLPVNQWVRGANLQPDYTLENHNIFHPSYVGCSSYFMTQAAMYFTYGRQPVPQAATHHLLDIWGMYQTVLLPWGESAYPQGMDWELHGLPYINLFAALATRQHDRLASHLEQQILQYLRAWQAMRHGELDVPGSRFGIGRHAVNAEQAAYGYLAHKIFGPAARPLSEHGAAAREWGVRDYPYVDFIAQRTPEKFASFSWKNRIMGVVMPIADGHGDNPDFTVPIVNGFVGSFDLTPRNDGKAVVVEHTREQMPNGFETSGTLLLNGGCLRQTLKMISLGARTVVYEDRVTALSNITVRAERGLPIGVENDEITGGTRTLTAAGTNILFDYKKPQAPFRFGGTWAGIDGRLGVVMAAGAGLSYVEAKGYARGICVYPDTLYGSYSDQTRRFKAGDEVTRRVAVVFLEVTPKETAAAAQTCRIETTAAGQVLHFKPPGEKSVEIRLD